MCHKLLSFALGMLALKNKLELYKEAQIAHGRNVHFQCDNIDRAHIDILANNSAESSADIYNQLPAV